MYCGFKKLISMSRQWRFSHFCWQWVPFEYGHINKSYFYANADSAHVSGVSLRVSQTDSASSTACGTQLELWLCKVNSKTRHFACHQVKTKLFVSFLDILWDICFFLVNSLCVLRCWASPQSSFWTGHQLHLVVIYHRPPGLLFLKPQLL